MAVARPPRAPSTNASSQTYLLFLGTLLFVTMTGNVLHHHVADPHNVHRHAMQQFERTHLGGLQKEKHEEKRTHKAQQARQTREGEPGTPGDGGDTAGAAGGAGVRPPPPPPAGGLPHWQEQPVHDLAGLNCADHGGPAAADVAEEMVYWRDIPSDASFQSPIRSGAGGEKKYLTFDPDGGGFNNIRMSLETNVVMAHAMGRTLVMPPSQGMYLLRKDRDKQRVHFSFDDFYHMEQVGYEHAGLDIISMEEYLKAEAVTGRLRNQTTGKVAFPPENRTNWDGIDYKPLKDYLRDVTLTPLAWQPEKCLAAFPSDDGVEHFAELVDMQQEIQKGPPRSWSTYHGKPTAVDAAPLERMREAVSGIKNKLCIYDREMQEAPTVHFMCYHKLRVRMLTHFYAFLFFEDWRHDLWSKRFVRDHLRYSDEIQCAAARVVTALRDRARGRAAIPHSNPEGLFDSFHIRRGDFQYKKTRLEAKEIYDNTAGMIPEGATVYVATDHQSKPWFQPLADHYDLVFMNDFKKELEGVNSNYFGMIDQLVASRGRSFFGCYHSTFSGFIFRMRGYHSQKEQLDGWEQGAMHHSFYYTGDKRERKLYGQYTAVHSAVYAREFPTSWRDIDKGIEELSSAESQRDIDRGIEELSSAESDVTVANKA